ncbi:MAG: dTDP-4-dehydrorhamnose reductase [Acidobacteria bacterium]|nr:dTDP-4-dehydrorhamnose reductase [Acidobacteriota bacterium]
MGKKAAIFGSAGMLGRDLVTCFTENNWDVAGFDVGEVDITDAVACLNTVSSLSPDIVINAAAFTDVDRAEKEKDAAFAVNATGAHNLSIAAEKAGCKIIYYSTDYIFDGRKTDAYTEEDKPNTLSSYGASKLKGEELTIAGNPNHLIIRTSWLYGKHGKNFIRSIINAASQKNELEVVNDQRGAPTYTVDLAEAALNLVQKDARGICNFANGGATTWYDFAKIILDRLNITEVEVKPITTAQLKRPARRPANSLLSLEKYKKLTGETPPEFTDALERYFKSVLFEMSI